MLLWSFKIHFPLLLECKTQLMGKEKLSSNSCNLCRKNNLFFLLADGAFVTPECCDCVSLWFWKIAFQMNIQSYWKLKDTKQPCLRWFQKHAAVCMVHIMYYICSIQNVPHHFSEHIHFFDWNCLESRQGLCKSSTLLYKASAAAQRDRESCLLLIIGGERTLGWQADSWASQLSLQVEKS